MGEHDVENEPEDREGRHHEEPDYFVFVTRVIIDRKDCHRDGDEP